MEAPLPLPVLDAIELTRYQACKRRFLLSRTWRQHRWTPKFLFDDTLRRAILKLSVPHPPKAADVAVDARARFMQFAADPGLDLPGDEVYMQAKEWSTLLDVIIRVLGQTTLLTLRKIKSVPLSEHAEWKFLAAGADDSGMLHRWITVSRWDQSAFMREVHGWPVIGDIVMARMPLQLHVVVLGQLRGQGRKRHHHSAWGRRFCHPTMPVKPHFLSPTGKPLTGWTPQFLAELPGEDPEAWARQAIAERAIQPLLHHPIINCPSDEACRETRRQIILEAEAMDGISDLEWNIFPMVRASCDSGFRPCPFQPCCHADTFVDPEKVGLYVRRDVLYQIQEKLHAPSATLDEARAQARTPRSDARNEELAAGHPNPMGEHNGMGAAPSRLEHQE